MNHLSIAPAPVCASKSTERIAGEGSRGFAILAWGLWDPEWRHACTAAHGLIAVTPPRTALLRAAAAMVDLPPIVGISGFTPSTDEIHDAREVGMSSAMTKAMRASRMTLVCARTRVGCGRTRAVTSRRLATTPQYRRSNRAADDVEPRKRAAALRSSALNPPAGQSSFRRRRHDSWRHDRAESKTPRARPPMLSCNSFGRRVYTDRQEP